MNYVKLGSLHLSSSSMCPSKNYATSRRSMISSLPTITQTIFARMGLGYVPDDRRIFADLTVRENLDIAERKARQGSGWNHDRTFELFPALKSIQARRGGFL